MKQTIETREVATPHGFYSQAVLVGNLLFISGQLPLNALGKVVGRTVEEQTEQALRNVQAILGASDGKLSNLVQTTVYIRDIGEWSRVNAAYERFLSGVAVPPARAVVPVADLHYNCWVKSRQSRTSKTQMNVQIRKPRTDAEFERYYDLRWRILREPWTHRASGERDEREEEAIHLSAWLGNQLVGVGRVHFNSAEEGQIRFMAVEGGFRDQGIGSQLLEALEDAARSRGARRIVLNARELAIKFYSKHEYQVKRRAETLFGSVDHWEMQKEL